MRVSDYVPLGGTFVEITPREIAAAIFWIFITVAGGLFLGVVVAMFLSRHWREWMRRKRNTGRRTPVRFGKEDERQEG
ncbi:MAG: hypothetical protein R6X20_13900 [Phycisphaerae bacterium]